MSRIANKPVEIPSGVTVDINKQEIKINGKKGSFNYSVNEEVKVEQDGNDLKFSSHEGCSNIAIVGTMRSIINNMLIGVDSGFEKKLTIIGVGYRAKVNGNKLNLNLGFSHPIDYDIPKEIEIETPSNTEIIVRGCDKQMVGQVSANIRSYRPPEPYKGKGVRYSDEYVIRKETKKK